MEKNNHRGKKKKKRYFMKERLSKAKWLKTFKMRAGKSYLKIKLWGTVGKNGRLGNKIQNFVHP